MNENKYARSIEPLIYPIGIQEFCFVEFLFLLKLKPVVQIIRKFK